MEFQVDSDEVERALFKEIYEDFWTLTCQFQNLAAFSLWFHWEFEKKILIHKIPTKNKIKRKNQKKA